MKINEIVLVLCVIIITVLDVINFVRNRKEK